MSAPHKYDVFISYRRDGGDDLANWVNEHLVQSNYHPYLDVDSYAPGDYTVQIENAIRESDSVIIILTHGCLNRCVEDKDLVREEIKTAFRLHKKIIPIMKYDFSFPQILPDDIDFIRRINALVLPKNASYKEVWEKLVRALQSGYDDPRAYESEPKKAAFSLSVQDWSFARLNHLYAGIMFNHVSLDLRLIAMIDPQSRKLRIIDADARRIVCELDPVRHPFEEYQLHYRAASRYLCLIRRNEALIYDIMRQIYVTKKEVLLPFASKRTWDCAFSVEENTLLFFDNDRETVNMVVRLSADGTAQAISLKKYAFGSAISSAQLQNRDVAILADSRGGLSTLMIENGKLTYSNNEQTIAACLKSGKRLSDAFSRDNQYWSRAGSNGTTRYTDFFRTQDGRHLHRIFHGDNGISFTRRDTVIWYDAQNGCLIEEDFLNQKNRLLADERYFNAQEAFYGRPPVVALYVYEIDAIACFVPSPEFDTFRIVLIDCDLNCVAMSENVRLPDNAERIQIKVEGMRMAIAFHCKDREVSHTEVYTSCIREE